MSAGRRLLWMALVVTIVATLWPLPDNDATDAAATRPSRDRNRANVLDASTVRQLGAVMPARPARQGEIVDLFPRQGWTAPPTSAAPDEPTAPALPFAYGGRYTEGGNIFVFLIEGARVHAVRQGETVNATYRIAKIAPDAITLTYLPLGLQQSLPTGGASPP